MSCDLNYRKKLWSRERAGEVMAQLMPYVDVIIANEEDAADVFGIRAEGTDVNAGVISREEYISVARQLSSGLAQSAWPYAARQHFRQRKRLGRYAV